MLLALDHQTALSICPTGKSFDVPLGAGEINWLTTRSHNEVLWHPARDEPLIEPPSWAPHVSYERGHLPGAALSGP
jgi:hypothetical protein